MHKSSALCANCKHYLIAKTATLYAANIAGMCVAFGTSLFYVSPNDFAWLLDVLRMICDKEEICTAEECKNILVPTPYPEVQIVLSPKEAFRLLAILEEADSEMKAEQFLQLFGQ